MISSDEEFRIFLQVVFFTRVKFLCKNLDLTAGNRRQLIPGGDADGHGLAAFAGPPAV